MSSRRAADSGTVDEPRALPRTDSMTPAAPPGRLPPARKGR
ncbi:hypothetical protein ABSL23_13785 [Halobacterium sp. NMX12-1]|uniref:Uncharacterized protein n=1 Tax=Halobacterium sp. NMX12-1 TaxID=3166650 RepID=A0AAU8CB28_9EURY